MRLVGKRVAILAENDYEDLELLYPMLRLREEGAEVTIVGSGSASSTPAPPTSTARWSATGISSPRACRRISRPSAGRSSPPWRGGPARPNNQAARR